MIKLEQIEKLKNKGFSWKPKTEDKPDMGQMLDEVERLGYYYELSNTGYSSDGTKYYSCYVYKDRENDDDYVNYSPDSLEDAIAKALIHIM